MYQMAPPLDLEYPSWPEVPVPTSAWPLALSEGQVWGMCRLLDTEDSI